MELFFALGLPILLIMGLTFLFKNEEIPLWIQNLVPNHQLYGISQLILCL